MERKLQREAEYLLSPVRCESSSCDNPIPYKLKRTNRYCSSSCSARENNARRQHTTETKKKIALSLLEPLIQEGRVEIVDGRVFYKKTCSCCGKDFSSKTRRRKTCSVKCSRKQSRENTDLEKASRTGKAVIQRLMEEGRWQGWSGRGTRSYPEQWVEQALKDRGIHGFEMEKNVSRFSIDFAFTDLSLALEVDGKQHNYPKNRAHDERRDAFLASKGWTVFRMPWKSVKTPAGLAHMESQIEKFVAVWKERSKA